MLEMVDVGNRQVFSQEQLSFDERKGRRKSSGKVSFYRPLGCFDDGGDGGWTIDHWCQSYGSRYSTVPIRLQRSPTSPPRNGIDSGGARLTCPTKN